MPEYLAPGVYVEEVSFRSKSIEGVATSTTGFAGMTRTGPVQYTGGPGDTEPRLITSFTEFERVYGSLDLLQLSGGIEHRPYLAYAARAFFENGGKRLYVSRVFAPAGTEPDTDDPRELREHWGVATHEIAGEGNAVLATWVARWPGAYGNVRVSLSLTRSGNMARKSNNEVSVPTMREGAVVELRRTGDTIPGPEEKLDPARLRVVGRENGEQVLFTTAGQVMNTAEIQTIEELRILELGVTIRADDGRTDTLAGVGTSPLQPRFIGRLLDLKEPDDPDSMVWLDVPEARDTPDAPIAFAPAALMAALYNAGSVQLTGGHDGALATPNHLQGKAADPDRADVKATGLHALGEVTDIAIVALPDGGTYDDVDQVAQAADILISHAEDMRYRIAVVDGPQGSSLNEIRAFRARFDSSHAAMYHPWIEIYDPTWRPAMGSPQPRILMPPSGFVTGIYARTDVSRGVHKAPANELVRGLTRFEANINTPRQEVLNPEGINALRFFEGRGHRVWGARTMSSDPEWKYVNVRRLFNFIEHSIDRGTQWAVFEPNGPRLWDNVRRTVEDFLLVLWKNGALLGNEPEEAYFVRCDRTTMTQNDIDNGRLICLIGVAPIKPAEFVIFRIGQWTADAEQA